jgi:hypothetical protein
MENYNVLINSKPVLAYTMVYDYQMNYRVYPCVQMQCYFPYDTIAVWRMRNYKTGFAKEMLKVYDEINKPVK